jgi:hypothetical protein
MFPSGKLAGMDMEESFPPHECQTLISAWPWPYLPSMTRCEADLGQPRLTAAALDFASLVEGLGSLKRQQKADGQPIFGQLVGAIWRKGNWSTAWRVRCW